MPIPTPHISAEYGDFSKTVLMPGDPKRSEFVACNFLTSARLINDVRGVKGYTGLYKGAPVSVMASGMGMPSIGIYSHELFSFYGVENIIRIGSAGSMQPEVRVNDIVIALAACTDSNYLSQFGLRGTYAPACDYELLKAAAAQADDMNIKYHVGTVLSSDIFYGADPTVNEKWRKMGVLAVEMETAALYANAAYLNKRALTVCTISDSLISGEALSSGERERGFLSMIELALRTAAGI